MSRIQTVLQQLDFARKYTNQRLESIPQEQWFTIPPNGVSHIGWQVGHIAMAEYRLCLERMRGRTEADELLIPFDFLQEFARGSTARPAGKYSAQQIREIYDAVHERVLRELPSLRDEELDLPPVVEHPLLKTRWECLAYAPLHEMIHCGQIALIRRMLGYAPLF